jgi:hypothetical protein
MFGRVALVRNDVSEELRASIIRVTGIGELRTTFATANIPSSTILVTLMKDSLISSETSVLTRATQRNIPDDASHRREYLKSYTIITLLMHSRISANRIGWTPYM